MRKTVFFLNCLFAVLLLSVVAVAYPEVGHQFYGYAGSGTTVTADVGGVSYSATVDSEGYYGYDTLFFIDAQTDDMSGAEDGETITFSLDGTEITTYTFSIGGVTKLDFEDDPATAGIENISDADGDGVSDDEDICLGYNDSVDTDGDGAPDGCDTDADGDGIADSNEDDDDDDDSDSSSGGGKKSSSSSTDEEAEDCSHKWTCTSWNACEENGFQTRTCYYVGNCTQEGNQSDTRQRCTYVAPEEEPVIEEEKPTCYDGIQNQGERGKDCGGPCEACPTTVPVVEEPKTSGIYISLAIFLLLLIIAIILAHKYKDKLLPYWIKFKSKLGIKPKAAPVVAQQMQRPAMQYPQYQQQYKPQYPPVRK